MGGKTFKEYFEEMSELADNSGYDIQRIPQMIVTTESIKACIREMESGLLVEAIQDELSPITKLGLTALLEWATYNGVSTKGKENTL